MNKLLALVLIGTFCGAGHAAVYSTNETAITGARSGSAVSNRNARPGLPRRTAVTASPAISGYLSWLFFINEYIFFGDELSSSLFSGKSGDFSGFLAGNLGDLMGGGGGAGDSSGDE